MSGWTPPREPDARQKYYKAYLARVVRDALGEGGLEQDEVLRVVKEACDG